MCLSNFASKEENMHSCPKNHVTANTVKILIVTNEAQRFSESFGSPNVKVAILDRSGGQKANLIIIMSIALGPECTPSYSSYCNKERSYCISLGKVTWEVQTTVGRYACVNWLLQV
ncbi:hypothetical protein AVEN_173038-1 [Araneus ventricosus]|uniref:Uncharacterized protein n=1 Tax=Araneus ventricosus TaxID=182803 RepID=A0A4Y2K1J1_ARAVE|nr:hypothetical protein AVEN_173038-1 [Araneus ventricosus]